MVRLLLATALVAAIVGAASGPAPAKEKVVARVLTPLPHDAKPGTRLTVVWTLSYVEAGERRPLSAIGVFIRLFGHGGSAPARVYAAEPVPGRYRARVTVPRGGVRRVSIGLMGWNDDGPAPYAFPLAGDLIR